MYVGLCAAETRRINEKSTPVGAWGTGVLQNDKAMDALSTFCKKTDSDTVKSFLDSNITEERLLGVALVDAAANGFRECVFGCVHEYEPFLSNLPNLTELQPKAREVVDAIATDSNELNSWMFSKSRTRRKRLYAGLQRRLNTVNS